LQLQYSFVKKKFLKKITELQLKFAPNPSKKKEVRTKCY
jgi:hypothetical protein